MSIGQDNKLLWKPAQLKWLDFAALGLMRIQAE